MREDRQGAQVVDAAAVEADREEELDRLLEAGRDQKAPLRWQLADEELEGADRRRHARLEVGGAHGELVEVGRQTVAAGLVQGFERAHPCSGIASTN